MLVKLKKTINLVQKVCIYTIIMKSLIMKVLSGRLRLDLNPLRLKIAQ